MNGRARVSNGQRSGPSNKTKSRIALLLVFALVVAVVLVFALGSPLSKRSGNYAGENSA